MVPKNFDNTCSKTTKTDSNVTDIREIYGCMRYQCTFLLFLMF